MKSKPVTNAVLRLYHIEGENDTWGNAKVYQVTSNWNFGSISFDQPVGPSLGILVGNSGPFNQYIEFDITAQMQAWQADPSSNHGLSIRGVETSGMDAKYFQSAEGANPPEIVVTYDSGQSQSQSQSAPIQALGADQSYEAPSSPVLQGMFSSDMGFTLSWASTADTTYYIERRTNLCSGVWDLIETNIAATPPENVYTDPDKDVPVPVFYRVNIQ